MTENRRYIYEECRLRFNEEKKKKESSKVIKVEEREEAAIADV